MNRDIWGVFHDGVLKHIDGGVPGTLTLDVEIEYLRAMFDEPGISFRIELTGCTKVIYNEYEQVPTVGCSSQESHNLWSRNPTSASTNSANHAGVDHPLCFYGNRDA